MNQEALENSTEMATPIPNPTGIEKKADPTQNTHILSHSIAMP